MKSFIYAFSGALAVFALTAGAPDLWAQSKGHGGGGGGGGARTNSGGGGGGTAVARGSGGSSGGSGGGHATSSGGTRASGPSGGQGGSAAPRGGTRPNYGSPAVGQATPRPGYPANGHPGYPGYYPGHGYNHGYYYPYNPYYLYGYGAFGLGAFYYDPYWWGYPVAGPYGYPYPYYYGGGGGGYADGGYAPSQEEGPKGGLKLKVEPKTAEVYADGYFMGRVDDFDSAFQRLNLSAGPHRIEIKAPGYQTLSFDVKIEPRDTISYSAQLQAVSPR